MIEVVPVSVGVASRSWDGQHVDLAAASRQIDGAGTAGFTETVAGVATRFTDAWTRFARDLGRDCESRADGLRAAIRDYVGSDEASYADLLRLTGFLTESR